MDKKLRVRGVIALPASLTRFCTVRSYRGFFFEIRDVLWRLGYTTRLIFYERDEAEGPDFPELLRRYNVDVVIWLLPSSSIKETAARIIDHGTRLMILADSWPSTTGHHYRMSRWVAFREGLIDWQRSRISSVSVVTQQHRVATSQLANIERCLRDVGMPYQIVNNGPTATQDWLRGSPPRTSHAFVFPRSEQVVQLAYEHSTHWTKFLEENRVMLMEGIIDLPLEGILRATADIIAFDWKIIGNRIGSDLVNPARFQNNRQVVFEAKWINRATVNNCLSRIT